jgi:sugar/nucleoside kinase (ribokinase family)
MRTLLLGEALVDLICERPVSDMQEADAFVPHFGGAVANVAVAAARRGAHVALAGGAGEDAWGTWLRDRLAAEKVDLDWFGLRAGVLTPVAFVTVDLRGEPSYAIYGDTIEAVIEALEGRLDEAVDRCDAIFLTSNTLVGERERELSLGARRRALEQGKPVLFDPNLRLHRWAEPAQAATQARELVHDAFLVKCNGEEARLLTGEDDPEAAVEGLLAAGARHAVVTRGPHGAVVRGGGMKLDMPGEPAHPISTVGAGDVFMGTLIAGLSATNFYPPAIGAALRDAVVEGARATERWGAVG